jgi:mannose-6-phosphate isomerase-like protein (cupin superfamily)
MHINSKNKKGNLSIQAHPGEIITELIGRSFKVSTEIHSVAHVIIPPNEASLPHYHPIAEESYYILRGSGHIVLDKEESDISPGEIVLIPPTVPHQIFNNSDKDDLEFLVICVPAWEASNSVPWERQNDSF